MNEKAKEHLKQLILMDFKKYLKLKMSGYCTVNYNIAVACGLGAEFVEYLKAEYLRVFNTEL